MLFARRDRCDLVFDFFQNFEKNSKLDAACKDMFVPNLVHIGQAIGSTNSPEKKKTNQWKNIILPKF